MYVNQPALWGKVVLLPICLSSCENSLLLPEVKLQVLSGTLYEVIKDQMTYTINTCS